MSMSVHEDVEEVDLSKLINFGVTFEPLQLTIRDILRRLGQLERQNTVQDDRIDQLTSNVTDLEAANKALEEKVAALSEKVDANEKDDTKDKAGGDDEALWDEIARLNSVLGELQDGAERDRHTIDEIYAARKRHHSLAAGETGSQQSSRPVSAKPGTAGGAKTPAAGTAATTGGGRKPSLARPLHTTEESAPTKPVGDVILDRAREELRLDGTHVYTAFEETPAAVEGPHGTALPLPSSTGDSASATPIQAALPHRPHSGTSISFASRPQSGANAAAAGGEDAGEHRGSVAFAGSSVSRPTSHAQRRSIYADQRIAAAAARRASQFSGAPASDGASPSASVFDKLKRDGDDIAYLNRVVAEILGEMKDLHADVDQLRARPSEDDTGAATGSATVPPDGAAAAAAVEELEAVLRRLARMEGDVVDARQQLQHRDDGLQAELDDLKKQLRVARSMTDDDLDALRSVKDLLEKVRQMEERLRALEAAHAALAEQFASVLAVGERSGDGGASDVNAIQFAALQGAVKNLEKQLADLLAAQTNQQDWSEPIRKLTDAVRNVEGDLEAARDQLQRVAKEAARLEEAKANRSEVPDPALFNAGGGGKRRSSAEAVAMAELAGRLSRVEAAVDRLSEEKADRTALQKLRDELNALRQMMDAMKAQRGEGDVSRTALGKLEKAVRDLQVEMNNLKDAYRNGGGGGGIGGEDVEDLKDRLERLDHCKADATLVANKAERDYVENALERLMREVEQVLNATNAGLIDTLEKSLNILRDMIDGKATKQDVANLQGWVAESGGGAGAGASAADGLTGFKGFRCLGCNRPMDNMRPRTLPATMTPFLNRNPQNFPQDNVTRTIQQQQQRVGGNGGGGGVGSHSAGARPAAAVGSPDASLHRSTNSEPLPPIEPA